MIFHKAIARLGKLGPIADQAAISATMLAVSLVILRWSNLREAYEASVLLIAYALAVGLSRSMYAEPLAVHGPLEDVPKATYTAAVRKALQAAALIILCAAAFRTFSTIGLAIVTAAVSAVVFDSVRAVTIAHGRAHAVLRYSGPLAMATIGACVLGWFSTNPLWAPTGWALACITATARAIYDARGRKAEPHKVTLKTSTPFIGEFVVTTASTQLVLLACIPVVGDALPVANRVGSVMYGVYFSLFQVVALLAIPHWRRKDPQPSILIRSVQVTALLLVVWCAWSTLIATAYTLGLTRHLGTVIDGSDDLVLAYGLSLLGGVAAAGPLLAIRSHGAMNWSVTLRVIYGVLQVALPVAAISWIANTPATFFYATALAGLLAGLIGIVMVGLLGRKVANDVAAIS